MSNEAREAVINYSRQKGNAYNLMLAIAEHAKPWGHAFPSVDTLARVGHMSIRTVQNLLPKLEAAGELHIIRGIGRHNVSEYWITVGNLHLLAHEKGECSCTFFEIKGANPVQEKVQVSAEKVQLRGEKVQTVAPEPTEPREPGTEPPSRRPAKSAKSAKPAKPESPELAAVCALWAEMGLGHISQNAKGELRKLLAEFGRELVEQGLRKASSQSVSYPVSWMKAVIPGLKRERERGTSPPPRNGTGPPTVPRANPPPSPFAVFGRREDYPEDGD